MTTLKNLKAERKRFLNKLNGRNFLKVKGQILKVDAMIEEQEALTTENKNTLNDVLRIYEEHMAKQINLCRQFKWLCHAHLPQAGEGYVANKNVFDIEEKTVNDYLKKTEQVKELIMKIINQW